MRSEFQKVSPLKGRYSTPRPVLMTVLPRPPNVVVTKFLRNEYLKLPPKPASLRWQLDDFELTAEQRNKGLYKITGIVDEIRKILVSTAPKTVVALQMIANLMAQAPRFPDLSDQQHEDLITISSEISSRFSPDRATSSDDQKSRETLLEDSGVSFPRLFTTIERGDINWDSAEIRSSDNQTASNAMDQRFQELEAVRQRQRSMLQESGERLEAQRKSGDRRIEETMERSRLEEEQLRLEEEKRQEPPSLTALTRERTAVEESAANAQDAVLDERAHAEESGDLRNLSMLDQSTASLNEQMEEAKERQVRTVNTRSMRQLNAVATLALQQVLRPGQLWITIDDYSVGGRDPRYQPLLNWGGAVNSPENPLHHWRDPHGTWIGLSTMIACLQLGHGLTIFTRQITRQPLSDEESGVVPFKRLQGVKRKSR